MLHVAPTSINLCNFSIEIITSCDSYIQVGAMAHGKIDTECIDDFIASKLISSAFRLTVISLVI